MSITSGTSVPMSVFKRSAFLFIQFGFSCCYWSLRRHCHHGRSQSLTPPMVHACLLCYALRLPLIGFLPRAGCTGCVSFAWFGCTVCVEFLFRRNEEFVRGSEQKGIGFDAILLAALFVGAWCGCCTLRSVRIKDTRCIEQFVAGGRAGSDVMVCGNWAVLFSVQTESDVYGPEAMWWPEQSSTYYHHYWWQRGERVAASS